MIIEQYLWQIYNYRIIKYLLWQIYDYRTLLVTNLQLQNRPTPCDKLVFTKHYLELAYNFRTLTHDKFITIHSLRQTYKNLIDYSFANVTTRKHSFCKLIIAEHSMWKTYNYRRVLVTNTEHSFWQYYNHIIFCDK